MTKRPTSTVLLMKPDKDSKYFETYQKLEGLIRQINPYLA